MIKKLPKLVNKGQKRVGRGYGSGKGGHTSSRGQKGQKSRRHIGVMFEGYKVKKSFFKRLPLRRGRGKLKASSNKPIVLRLSVLNSFTEGATIDSEFLVKAGLLVRDDFERCGVKILGGGQLDKKFTVNLPVSKSAAIKIEKAGGKVV